MVVDTSAIVAVLFGEPGWREIEEQLRRAPCAMSAATLVEVGIVVEAKAGPAGGQLLAELLDRVEMEIVAVDEALAKEALVCWRRFGRGRHPAALNYGDTFAYALARASGRPLLFVGDDFGRTDVEPA